MSGDGSGYADRIGALAQRARRTREAFDPPADPPAEDRALRYLREGLGPTVAVYLEARTGDGDPVAFAPEEFSALEGAVNEWLELYAACYGVSFDAEFTVREAAVALLETHDVRDAARVLTRVPGRYEE